jgi:exodeoxyribonuclease-1
METIYWHDYETFGADTRKDRPCQFAGVRTDLDLNIIEEPATLYCKPNDDFLPSPDACLITGITPQLAYKEGVNEAEFSSFIHTIFSVPGTCVAGYNSIRFDDEISRNLFYRNFYDPYEREWKNGNSRWDIIDLLRLTFALRPEGINWPTDDNGIPSFRLERLTEANNIKHEAAHDAMSDVYATIAVAKLIKEKQPQLFDYVFKHKSKNSLLSFFENTDLKPIFHVSSKYPASIGCSALVVPLFKNPNNSNGYVVFDLRQNPEELDQLSADEIKSRLYSTNAQLQDQNKFRPALKTIHVNKCPMVCPASVVKSIPEDRLIAWNLNMEKMTQHLAWIRSRPEFISKIYSVFSEVPGFSAETDPDLMIYSGFLSDVDKKLTAEVRAATEIELAEKEFHFVDQRLPELFFRYKARNFPGSLNEDESDKWEKYRTSKLLSNNSQYLTFNLYFERIQELASSENVTDRDLSILEDLKYYAESILPYSYE